ncbi:hypothetical protein ILUMI_26885 [Ignelater luminosus]|uniref:Uncharacterized protein n=1 Tax=Ignelater luminosus TaxID=2038154 RepID=A0A8K0C3Y6_IGNLU|nr:hypothetical protein ILUMI_26885 [Ignelater luminosus]
MSKTIPDFSLVTFLPPSKHAKEKPGERTDLFKFFEAVIKSQELEVDQNQLEKMFCIDLTIDTAKLDKRLVGVLGEALVYYMTTWPGWQRSNEYSSGQLQCKEWYERFRQYLIFKSNFIIKNAPKFTEEVCKETKDETIQTDISIQMSEDDKRTAPYILNVSGPPSILNNIVFMEANGHVLIKQHKERPWCDLRMNEILNWPHVSVEVKLPDIYLSRSNVHKFHRYIAVWGDNRVSSDKKIVSHIKKINQDDENELKVYSYDFISNYLNQLTDTLKKLPGVEQARIQELETIFTEYLADIKEVDVYNCTMCTNMSVAYHIGKCKYIRNKKMVSSNSEKKDTEKTSISFYEILTPHMEFALHYFNVLQDMCTKDSITFQSLNRLNKLISKSNNEQEVENLKFLVNSACIVYHCTFCNENFSGPYARYNLTTHFSEKHKDEQAVLCLKCYRQFFIKELAKLRWAHNCV